MAKTARDVVGLVPSGGNGALEGRRRLGGIPTKFDARQTKRVLAELAGIVEYAKKIQDWELGMDAARAMVEWQTEFVAEWKEKVTPGQHGDGSNQHKRVVRDRGPPIVSVKVMQEETGITKQQVSHWQNAFRDDDYWKRIIRPSHNRALADAEERYELMTGETEWFTPAEYIEKVRRVLGKIDLDPASCKEAQRVVKAKRFYTREDNGLLKPWKKGTVFLNPPYEGKSIAAFSAKLLAELEAGNVTGAIMLTNGYTDSNWFHNLGRPCNALCLTRSRIKFVSPKGDKRAPTNGQCFFYYGDKRERFLAEFADVGMLLVHP